MSEPVYTPEDMEAWLADNPWDSGNEQMVADMFGFQAFVLGRRLAEAITEITDTFDEPTDRAFRAWGRVQTRLGKWWRRRRFLRALARQVEEQGDDDE